MGIIEMTVDEFKEELELLCFEHGIRKLLVKEELIKLKDQSYVVEGLRLETEEDMIFFTDYNDILMKNNCILSMFLKRKITTIHRAIIDEKRFYHLQLHYGTITISTV